jgi:hypothetical protein
VNVGLGEPNLKRALQWLLDRLADNPQAKRSQLIDEASRQFDLNPLEADFLYRQLVEAEKERGGKRE